MKIDLNLEKFFENKPKQVPNMANINIAGNPNINKSLLDMVIDNGTINQYTDEQLYELLYNNLRGFLLNIFEKEDQRYIKMIISDRFLRILINVVANSEIDYMNKIYLNKLCYDYLTLEDKAKNSIISEMIYNLAKITNKHHISLLTGLNIPEKIACYVVLARFSTNDEFVNVTRMNFVIMTAHFNFTEQMVVDIYQNLFDRVTQLFEATMLDVIDTSEEWYTEEIDEKYSLITLAVLDILNSLPSDAIRRVLDEYVRLYHISYAGRPVRCDIRCLSGDFERIVEIVELMYNEGIRLP